MESSLQERVGLQEGKTTFSLPARARELLDTRIPLRKGRPAPEASLGEAKRRGRQEGKPRFSLLGSPQYFASPS